MNKVNNECLLLSYNFLDVSGELQSLSKRFTSLPYCSCCCINVWTSLSTTLILLFLFAKTNLGTSFCLAYTINYDIKNKYYLLFVRGRCLSPSCTLLTSFLLFVFIILLLLWLKSACLRLWCIFFPINTTIKHLFIMVLSISWCLINILLCGL